MQRAEKTTNKTTLRVSKRVERTFQTEIRRIRFFESLHTELYGLEKHAGLSYFKAHISYILITIKYDKLKKSNGKLK